MIALRAGLFAVLMCAGHALASDDPVLAPPTVPLPPALDAIRVDLQRIVSTRNLAGLRAHVRADTTLSFGGDAGPQGFDDVWAHDADATRRLWQTLEAILALPGVATQEDGVEAYCAPYVFCLPYEGDIDVFDAQVVLGSHVAIRTQADAQAPVIARVSHVVLTGIEGDDDAGAATGWMRVRLASGQEGYIAAHLVRSPIDHRFSIIRDGKADWAFQYFVAGD